MGEGLSHWSSMVLRKSQTCFSDRHTHPNSMYSNFCHVLKNERKLNRIKFALKRESDRLNLESQQKYKSELEKASLQYKRMFSQYKEWQIKESGRVSKLKIIVPDALQTTYEKLSLLEE